jgi:hypothetical protein
MHLGAVTCTGYNSTSSPAGGGGGSADRLGLLPAHAPSFELGSWAPSGLGSQRAVSGPTQPLATLGAVRQPHTG